jgi:heptosyltransferase-2
VSGEQQGGVLVIQTAFPGDVILTTGLLSYLALRAGPVDVVATPAGCSLLTPHPAVRRTWRYDKRDADRGAGGLFRLAARLRAERYRTVYLPHRSLRSAVLAMLARIPMRIGFAGSAGAWSYTRRVERPASGHEAERILAVAEPAPGTGAQLSLALTDADRRIATEWLAERSIAEPFVAIAPGSIWGSKRWPGYDSLVRALPGPVVVVGGVEDRGLALAVVAAAPGRAHSAAGELSFRASAALIERARVLVSNDSAPLHLGSAVGTPVVAIFGPTVPSFGFGPRGLGDVVVERNGLACRPCSSHGPEVCPLGHHRCMKEISVERVLVPIRESGEPGSRGAAPPNSRIPGVPGPRIPSQGRWPS